MDQHDTDFDTWLVAVDRVYSTLLGLGSDDLGDAPWRDYYGDDMTPREAVAHALVDWQDFPFEDLSPLGLGGIV